MTMVTNTKNARFDDEAQNTSCAYEGCDGSQHEAVLPASEWRHEVARETFSNGTIECTIHADPTRLPEYYANIEFDSNGEMTAAELRKDADEFEAFPAWLRGMADRVNALNRTACFNRSSKTARTAIDRLKPMAEKAGMGDDPMFKTDEPGEVPVAHFMRVAIDADADFGELFAKE